MADQPKTQMCANCRYHQKAAEFRASDGRVVYQDSTVVCKRYPPLSARSNSGPSVNGMGFVILPSDMGWCGEWAPANPETVEEGAATMARLVILGDLTATRALADKLRE